MPIRFHCPRCDQRLSVSSRKALKLVKCPTCQGTLTVPTEAEAESAAAERKRARKEGRRSGTPGDSQAGSPFDEFAVFDQDSGSTPQSGLSFSAARSESLAPTPSPGSIDYGKVAVSRNILYYQGALLAVVAVLCFVIGILVGRAVPREDLAAQLAKPCQVRGKIVFVNRNNERIDDDNSVIVALPFDERPTESIAVEGIRPADPRPIEDHPSLAAIEVLGGSYARANARGEFEMQLPRRGRYFLLVISRNQQSTQSRPKTHTAQMSRYFASVSQLLRQQDYRWTEEFFRGDRAFDVTFER